MDANKFLPNSHILPYHYTVSPGADKDREHILTSDISIIKNNKRGK